ncbi:hypothetical protein UCRPC4_g00111 [Phaeomoniella chlamydospora]|uniref:Uncharacterized protein n=1 Tax=Phaeomoniella chlamydospora TaxID=158046 RepID=A0A0G2HLK5_PHACM|nr:hypothetical protein UCRPC4_g00111 [Phaeomoniella chlamydospora]
MKNYDTQTELLYELTRSCRSSSESDDDIDTDCESLPDLDEIWNQYAIFATAQQEAEQITTEQADAPSLGVSPYEVQHVVMVDAIQTDPRTGQCKGRVWLELTGYPPSAANMGNYQVLVGNHQYPFHKIRQSTRCPGRIDILGKRKWVDIEKIIDSLTCEGPFPLDDFLN